MSESNDVSLVGLIGLDPAPGAEPSTAQTHTTAAPEDPPGAFGPVPSGTRLTEPVLDAIAMLAAELVPPESIALGTGVPLDRVRRLIVVEASFGQLEDELRLALSRDGERGLLPIESVRRYGGALPSHDEIVTSAARAPAGREGARA